MKKLIILLALLIPFVFVNVNAEEVAITEENSYLLFDMIEDKYFTNNSIDKENCYFVVYQRRNVSDYIYIYVDDKPFSSDYSNELNVVDNLTKMVFRYSLLDFTFSSYSVYSSDFYEEIYFSNHDIVNNNAGGSIVFAKNYPLEEEIQIPTPTPKPTLILSFKTYVPDLENYSCFVVRSEEVIRAYKEVPKNNTEIEYRDYYYNSNYLYNDGIQSFSTYATLPTCLDSSVLTDDVYYRNDFDSILVIFICLCLIFFAIPIKILFRLFRRFN